MNHEWRSLFGGLAVALAAGWSLYNHRPRERIPCHESIDDPGIARAYGWVTMSPPMRLLRWFVARRAVGMIERGEVVDLGCGPGKLVIELARQSPGLHVTGIDLSEEMIARGQNNARRESVVDRVSFRQGDAQQIPFPDGSLDLVVSTLSLHHWSDPVAVLDEMARVLRPGGSFLIFDLRRDMVAPCWLMLWFVTNVVVPTALRRANEPLSSRNAAYTPQEAARLAAESLAAENLAAEKLAAQSRLSNWRVTCGPMWLIIEGTTAGSVPTTKRHTTW